MVAVSLFVPCYNEEQRLEKNILLIYDACVSLHCTFELVIVDDNSHDRTQEIGMALADKYTFLSYLRYNTGPSRRENLAKAMQTAHSDIVVFMDLDLSVPLSHLPELVARVKNSDIAIGSRYKGQVAKRTFVRKVISSAYNAFMRLYFHSSIHDHQCGFKAFKKQQLLLLLDEMGYDDRFIRGWFWDVELLLRAQRKKYTIDEFSVAWTFGKKSSFEFGRELKMLPYVLLLRWRMYRK